MAEPQTRAKILAAAKEALLEAGYASLSTRRIAESVRHYSVDRPN